jgi:uracil-DNA glycosylase family 4
MRCSLIFLEAVRVADPRRLYLKLQAELGGAEVYLARPGEVRLPAAGTVGAGTGVPPAEATGDEVTDQSDATAGGRPARAKTDWRRNLPAIPGPGLEIVAPEAGLLDPLPLYPGLADLATAVRECQRCFLCQGRTNTVPGEGDPQAGLMCVGEGPGETEDRTGRPFVGRAGELLNGILAAIELSRESVFIANVVKCRPPQNRKPLPDEMQACLPYLRRQIQLIRPKVLLALGATAAEGLLGVRKSLGELRGRVHRFDGIPLVVTYHPAALLRNPNWKKPTWDDVRIARQLLDA